MRPSPTSSTPQARRALRPDSIVLDWNDTEGVRAAFAGHGHEVAAAVLEPYIHTFGCVAPEPGFLEALRELTTRTARCSSSTR